MNIHFKRHCEMDRRLELLRAALISLLARIRKERKRQYVEELNRQRRDLNLAPLE